jgi:phage shock protein C
MYCTQCGNQLEDAHLFCSQCGKPTRSGYEAATPPRPRLSRPMDQKSIAGVCAGFARYFDTDVVLMRILWLAGAFLTGGMLVIAYIIAWILMPRDYPLPAAPATRVVEQT